MIIKIITKFDTIPEGVESFQSSISHISDTTRQLDQTPITVCLDTAGQWKAYVHSKKSKVLKTPSFIRNLKMWLKEILETNEIYFYV